MTAKTRRNALVLLAAVVPLVAFKFGHHKQEAPISAQQLAGARFVVEALASTGAIRDWDEQKGILVEASFEGMTPEQQLNACRALDVVRRSKGLKSGFEVREATGRHKVGRFRDGKLDLRS